MSRHFSHAAFALLITLIGVADLSAQSLVVTNARIIPNTAAFIEKSSEIGTLEPGKLADMVVLDGNPLEGYWTLLNARVVIKGGEVVVDKS